MGRLPLNTILQGNLETSRIQVVNNILLVVAVKPAASMLASRRLVSSTVLEGPPVLKIMTSSVATAWIVFAVQGKGFSATEACDRTSPASLQIPSKVF